MGEKWEETRQLTRIGDANWVQESIAAKSSGKMRSNLNASWKQQQKVRWRYLLHSSWETDYSFNFFVVLSN